MKVLVTGAGGFLGRHTVKAFLDHGHTVRALVRPASRLSELDWGPRVEVRQGDLRGARDLVSIVDGVDAVVHLAAAVSGDDETQFASSVVGTERLLTAMAATSVRCLILASTGSVYDWARARGVIDEQSPLADRDLYERDAYAIAKTWQERVVRRAAAAHGWDLRVIRPGYLWGPGHEWFTGAGHQAGRLWAIIGPLAHPPLTHVVNTADAFVTVAEQDRAAGQTYNVADEHGVTTWRFVGDYRRGTKTGGVRIPVPYWMGLTTAQMAKAVSRAIFGRGGKLPSILVPIRFQARFRPIHFDSQKIRRELGWKPPLDYSQCLEWTYAKKTALPSEGERPHKVLHG